MNGIKIFGVFFILLGGFLVYAILGTFFNVISGKKIKAKIVAVEKVESKRFTYLYYPIFEFSYKNKIVRQVNRSQSIDLKEVGTKTDIYYNNHQVSRGFTIVEIIFSVVGICFIFFGVLALFSRSLNHL